MTGVQTCALPIFALAATRYRAELAEAAGDSGPGTDVFLLNARAAASRHWGTVRVGHGVRCRLDVGPPWGSSRSEGVWLGDSGCVPGVAGSDGGDVPFLRLVC